LTKIETGNKEEIMNSADDADEDEMSEYEHLQWRELLLEKKMLEFKLFHFRLSLQEEVDLADEIDIGELEDRLAEVREQIKQFREENPKF